MLYFNQDLTQAKTLQKVVEKEEWTSKCGTGFSLSLTVILVTSSTMAD